MNGWLTVLCFVLVCGAYVWRGYFDYQKRKNELEADKERIKMIYDFIKDLYETKRPHKLTFVNINNQKIL